MLKRWLLMEGLVWRIWLLDWFQITCLNPVYHKFSQKLRRKAILSSSLRYVRNLLGPLVRIFSMSILLYNKFSLETPFLLLAALSWLLILAQTAPPQASARIFLPIPGEPPPQPNHTHFFFRMQNIETSICLDKISFYLWKWMLSKITGNKENVREWNQLLERGRIKPPVHTGWVQEECCWRRGGQAEFWLCWSPGSISSLPWDLEPGSSDLTTCKVNGDCALYWEQKCRINHTEKASSLVTKWNSPLYLRKLIQKPPSR